MPSILVTGAEGQLGKELAYSQKHYPDLQGLFTTKEELDITNPQQINDYLAHHPVDYIVNCAAYTRVDQAETDQAQAFAVNATGPAYLGTIASKLGCKLFHISTDYVFGERLTQPLEETMATQPATYYGQSKLAGEQKLLTNHRAAYIIRTSWLYSTRGNNFFKKMLALGKTKQTVSVVYNQVGSPTYARDLALVIWEMIRKVENATTYPPGIYHYANEGVASWYDFASAIMEYAKLDCKVVPILSRDFPTSAQRPAYSVLSKEKIKKNFHISIPHWRESLQHCIKDLKL